MTPDESEVVKAAKAYRDAVDAEFYGRGKRTQTEQKSAESLWLTKRIALFDALARLDAGDVGKCRRCLKPASDTIHGPHSACWDCDEPKAHHRFNSHLPPLEHDASRAGQDGEGA